MIFRVTWPLNSLPQLEADKKFPSLGLLVLPCVGAHQQLQRNPDDSVHFPVRDAAGRTPPGLGKSHTQLPAELMSQRRGLGKTQTSIGRLDQLLQQHRGNGLGTVTTFLAGSF